MIQPLRTVHRRAFMALAFVLPTVLLVGLTARRPLQHAGQGMAKLGSLQPIKQSDHLWAKHTIHSVFLKNTSDPTAVQVVLEPLDDLSAPDLLVYWSSELPAGDRLPATAVLLGAFGNSEPLQLRESHARGFLVLYSLAHQSIVDAAPLESVL